MPDTSTRKRPPLSGCVIRVGQKIGAGARAVWGVGEIETIGVKKLEKHRVVTDNLYVIPGYDTACDADVLARALKYACDYLEKEYSGRSSDHYQHFLKKALNG